MLVQWDYRSYVVERTFQALRQLKRFTNSDDQYLNTNPIEY